MTGFGAYEGVKEIHRSGAKSVWTARRAGSASTAAPKYAIRWLDPSAADWSSQETRQEVEQFLERAEIQRKAAAAGRYWAPVYAHGETDGRAALVTRHYRRTAEEAIQGKIAVGPEALYRIGMSVVRGLMQINRACGRPHGALRASAVLIGGKAKISKSKVVLCSPAPAAEVEGQGEQVDFASIGELIYALITHRPYRRGQLPIPPTDEWNRLGRKAEGWRELCSDLLDPSSSRAPADLRALRKRVRKLAPAPVGVRTVIVAGVLSVAVVAIAFLVYRINLDPRADWERLCYEYDTWVNKFVEDVSTGQIEAGGDSELAGALAKATALHDDAASSDPRLILNESGRSYTQLVDMWEKLKEDSAAYQKADIAAGKVQALRADMTSWLKRALGPVDALKSAIARDAPECRGALNDLNSLAIQLPLELRDLQKQTKSTTSDLLKSPDVQRADSLAQHVNRLRQTSPTLTEVAALLPAVISQANSISADEHGKSDAILSQFAAHVRKQLSSAGSLSELRDQLAASQTLARRLSDAMRDEWARDERPLTKSPPPVIDARTFESWLQNVQTELRGEQFVSWKARNDKQIADSAKIAADLKALQDYQAEAAGIDARYAAVRKQFDELSNRKWSVAAKDSVDEKLAALTQQLSKVNEELAALRSRRTSRDLLTRDAVVATDALNDAWRRLKEEANKAGSVERLETVLKEMEAIVPSQLAAADAPASLKSAYVSLREEMLKEAASELRARALSDAQVQMSRLRERLLSMKKHAEEVATESASLGSLLKGLAAPDEAFAAGQPALAKVVASLESHATDPRGRELLNQVQDVLKRGQAVVQIDESVDRAALVTQAKAPPPRDLLWAIWKKLQQQSGWPKDSGELDAELALRRELNRALEDLQKDNQFTARAGALKTQLASRAKPAAETVILSVASSQDELLKIDASLNELGVQPKDLAEPARYPLVFSRLMARLAARTATDEQAKAFVNGFKTELGTIRDPTVAARLKTVDQLIAAVEAAYANERHVAVSETLGPEKILGWAKSTIGPPADEAFVFTSPDQRQRLEFIRVTPGGRTATFVCTTELSLQLFIEIVNQTKAWKTFENGLGMYTDADDNRSGPRVWTLEHSSGRIIPSPQWLELNPADVGPPLNYTSIYPAGMRVAAPSLAHPIQHITPELAQAFAKLLICRLPTEEEWRQAYGIARARSRPAGFRENLRDATYWQIYDHLNKGAQTLSEVAAGYSKEAERPGERRQADGSPWVAPIGNGGDNRFHDLVGNVAEWVTKGSGYAAIGGSALTPWVDNPDVYATGKQDVEAYAYSDVGVRLALDAPVQSLAKSLRDNLARLMAAPAAASGRN